MVDNLLGDDFPFAEDILEGVDALVCGASKGIGRSCALMLARSGAKVTICSRSKDNLEKFIGQMYGSGHDYLVIDPNGFLQKVIFPQGINYIAVGMPKTYEGE